MVVGASLPVLPSGNCPEGIIVALAKQRDDSKLRDVGSPTAPQVRTLRLAWSWILLSLEDGERPREGGQGWVGSNARRSGSGSFDCGAVASRAAIARREGLSRARVTQLLKRLAGTLDGKRRASAGQLGLRLGSFQSANAASCPLMASRCSSESVRPCPRSRIAAPATRAFIQSARNCGA